MSNADNFKTDLTFEILAQKIAHDLVVKGTFLVHRKEGGLYMPVRVNGKDCSIFQGSDAQVYLKEVSTNMRRNLMAGDDGYRKGTEFKNMDYFNLSDATAKALLKTLLIDSTLHPKEPIKTFAFKSDPSLAFCRMPFDPSESVQVCPTWDVFMSNLTNVDAVKMWIGSIFFADSDRSQYLWFYGSGGNGKSTLSDIFKDTLGDFARPEFAPYTQSEIQFWTYGLIGKRLITIDECKLEHFVTSSLFKACTGSNHVRVEKKGEQAFDTRIDCKFLFTSNIVPSVSKDPADQRRLILTTGKRSFASDESFKVKLRAELPQFISNCMLLYRERCGAGKAIPTDNTEAMELGGLYNEEIDAWFHEYFEVDSEAFTKVFNVSEERQHAKLDIKRVAKYLVDAGYLKVRHIFDGHKLWCYKGFKQKKYRIHGQYQGKF